MSLKGKRIGVAVTGSFCTYEELFAELENLVHEGAHVQPILSGAAQSIDSRFGKAKDFIQKITEITGNKPFLSILFNLSCF